MALGCRYENGMLFAGPTNPLPEEMLMEIFLRCIESDESADERQKSGVYRPPKLAPMPYTEAPRGKDKDGKSRRRPVPSTLAALAHLHPSQPRRRYESAWESIRQTRAQQTELGL